MKINYRRKFKQNGSKPPHKDPEAWKSLTEKLITGDIYSTKSIGNDFVCGQHGAARGKKSKKHAATTARRRANKEYIRTLQEDSD